MMAPVAAAAPLMWLRAANVALHALGILCIALILWKLLAAPRTDRLTTSIMPAGTLDASLAAMLRAKSDTVTVDAAGVPDARARAMLRAVRGSGHVVQLQAGSPLPALAVTAESEWRASGGTRVQVVGDDSLRGAMRDGAGLLDSVRLDSSGLRARSGPVQGAITVHADGVRSASAVLAATSPEEARVLVVGAATWESRFLVAALEESGWPVDVAVSLSPRVTIAQGAMRTPSRSRHAIVVVLPGAPSSALSALPAFVRSGGGLVIVGEAARAASLSSLRAGAPGTTISGEVGAEASSTPRHGLDLVPIASLTPNGIALESRDGRTAVAARRVGAGRVVQVGYDNSWLWRMAGDDESPGAHRRWWNSLLSGIVPLAAPVPGIALRPEDDTLDAAPMAALARDLGLPGVRTARASTSGAASLTASLDVRWLLVLSLLSFVASWTLRRWRGLR
ncbi:MAG TPA: hypothetical protein VE861_14265 [Gemmatimonadaceae bacterium]|nr:hypothetical protein [Gemmatimonadaceae bacterium]